MTEQIRNWAGNVVFRPARSHHPASLDELQRIVAAATSVRVLGTGHSFNRIADTAGDLVILDKMPAEVRIDREQSTATVPAGMRLAELAAHLHAEGFALTALPSLPHISLAGACATGTHGSGDRSQGLAALVRALRFISPGGDVVELKRASSTGTGTDTGTNTDTDFNGAVVSLGALGVITQLTVDVVPTFDIAQSVYEGVPVPELIEHLDEVFAAAYSVSAFTGWRGDASVWVKAKANASNPENPDPDWLGGHLAHQAAHPIPGMSGENCTEQLGVPGPWHERLPHFRPDFTPSSGAELQSEFFLPRARAAEGLTAVRDLGPLIAPVLQISEIRTVAADDLWLSPAYRRDSVAFHFTWIADRASVEPALAEVERVLMPLGARPHWGKVYLGGPASALATYERADDFRDLLERHDPEGKFRNDFVRRLFPAR